MAGSVTSAPPIRFGPYELDSRSGELRRNGARLRLEGQPLQVLNLLLERPGELVSREELRQKLWPADTFVDFEHSINVAVKRLRETLQDSATVPRFIETLPRRGYRFIYPVGSVAQPLPSETELEAAKPRSRWNTAITVAAVAFPLAFGVFVFRDRLVRRQLRAPVQSVSVLPFKNLTGDVSQDFLADGVTDVLTTELAQTRKLVVPSVTSAMYYKSAHKQLPEISRELHVQAVVEGSVQRSGKQIQINVQLIDAASDRHLWAKAYEQDRETIQALLRRISEDLLSEMKVGLAPQELSVLQARAAANPEAVEAYLKGRYHLHKGTEQDRVKARDLFQNAIALDASYAAPYADLAVLYAHGGAYLAGTSGREARELTRQLARKALELDPSSSAAHRALGWIAGEDWDWTAAEREYQTARELSPNDPGAWYAQYLGYMRRFDEAFLEAERVMRLDPASPVTITHAAYPYYQAGRLDDAERLLRQALELDPNYWWARNFIARIHLLQGRYPDAIAEIEKSMELRGRDAATDHGLLAYAYARSGQRDKAAQLLQELERSRVPPAARLLAYVGLGDRDRAFQTLEEAYARHGALLFYLSSDPLWKELYADPRYAPLMRRAGFPETAVQSAVASANQDLLAHVKPPQ